MYCVYCYALHLNGYPCAKIGFSSKRLAQRIHNYLEKEHNDQSKDYSTFRILFCIEFSSKDEAKTCEQFIKSRAKKYPIYKEHKTVEQYKLEETFDSLKEHVIDKPFSFAIKVYEKDSHMTVNEILNKVPIYPKKKYIPKKKQSSGFVTCIYECENCNNKDKKVLNYLNKMTYSDFCTIDQIGDGRASALVRKQPFKSINDIYIYDLIGSTIGERLINYVERRV
jgi:predicted GIY-YIG superfamily endonuclease